MGDRPDDSLCGVFATTRIDQALSELLESTFDCVFIDEALDRTQLQLFVSIATLIDERLPVIWRGQRDAIADGDVTDRLDLILAPEEPIDPEEVEHLTDESGGSTGISHPAIPSLEHEHGDRPLARLDRNGTYLWTSERMTELVPVDARDLSGIPIEDAAPFGAASEMSALVTAVVESGCAHVGGAIDGDPHRRFCAVPLHDETILMFSHASETTVEFGGRYFDRLGELCFIIDFDGRFSYWNRAVNEVTGYTNEELLQLTALDLVQQSDRERARAKLAEVATSGEQTVELSLVTKAGETIPYQFSVSSIEDGEGDPQYVCSIGREISQRVEMREEIEAAIERLEASNEELERFAYVASHDLREPLRMVRSYLQLLQRRHGSELDDEAIEFLEFAVDGAERMRSMIEDLLTYSRVGIEVEQEQVDCEAVLEEVRENLSVAIAESGADITIEPLPTVAADRTLLLQLFQNLIGNAIEHAESDPPQVRISATRTDAGWEFEISDRSGGLSGVDEGEAFQLFTSGNDGTGIGLAICRKIVETFDGEIDVESDPGVGTTFYVTLPAAGED